MLHLAEGCKGPTGLLAFQELARLAHPQNGREGGLTLRSLRLILGVGQAELQFRSWGASHLHPMHAQACTPHVRASHDRLRRRSMKSRIKESLICFYVLPLRSLSHILQGRLAGRQERTDASVNEAASCELHPGGWTSPLNR